MKRIVAVLLAVMLIAGAVLVTPASAKTVVAKGIDLSKWQMPVDWNAVAANSNIDYAIIRCTWSGLETTEWSTFYPEAKAAGSKINYLHKEEKYYADFRRNCGYAHKNPQRKQRKARNR